MSGWKERRAPAVVKAAGPARWVPSIHDEARAIAKLATVDERRAKIATFERRHGRDQADLLRASIKAQWAEIQAEATA